MLFQVKPLLKLLLRVPRRSNAAVCVLRAEPTPAGCAGEKCQKRIYSLGFSTEVAQYHKSQIDDVMLKTKTKTEKLKKKHRCLRTPP